MIFQLIAVDSFQSGKRALNPNYDVANKEPKYESIDNYEIANAPDSRRNTRFDGLEEQNMRAETGDDEKPDNYLEVSEGELKKKKSSKK